MQDWLVSSFQRMTRFEYLTLWLTFAAIMVRLDFLCCVQDEVFGMSYHRKALAHSRPRTSSWASLLGCCCLRCSSASSTPGMRNAACCPRPLAKL
jgi:hypothetical protein